MNSDATTATDQGLILVGLDGSNPLAFLAAVGTLRILSLTWSNRSVRMAWSDQVGAGWRPVITADDLVTDDTVRRQAIALDAIEGMLGDAIEDHPIGVLRELKVLDKKDSRAIHQFFLERSNASTDSDREVADWLSAIASEFAPDATSQLQTTRRDYFYENLRSVMALTKRADLHRCLFAQWDYADPLANQSLHIDPTEDRRHAYQWHQPTSDPNRSKRGGMLGANRLAIEAIPLFQSVPANQKLLTKGFSGSRAHNTRWTWPIWSCPLACDEVSYLLSLSDLQLEEPDPNSMRARGIAAAFRCRRVLVEKTPNFTPATAVF